MWGCGYAQQDIGNAYWKRSRLCSVTINVLEETMSRETEQYYTSPAAQSRLPIKWPYAYASHTIYQRLVNAKL